MMTDTSTTHHGWARGARAAVTVCLAAALGVMGLADAHAQLAQPAAPMGSALDCLAAAIAYEAGYEPVEGRRAVAEVVLNRVRTSGYPKSVCEVVFQGSTRATGCQFTFTCDGALRRRLPAAVLAEARSIAEQALAGSTVPLVPGATHYHASYVQPRWASTLVRLTQIGAHIFYAPLHGDAGAAPIRDRPAPRDAAPAPAQPFAPWGLTPPAAATSR